MFEDDLPLACIMDAIKPEERPRYDALRGWLEKAALEIQELPNGYAFSLPPESDAPVKLAEFVSLERLCCPFLNFVIEVEPGQRAVWLRMTGCEGVREFLKEELGLIR